MHSLVRKVMLKIVTESSVSRQDTMFIFVSLHSGEFIVFILKANWHPVMWDHTKSWNEEEKLLIS